jgi:hypothetical protein
VAGAWLAAVGVQAVTGTWRDADDSCDHALSTRYPDGLVHCLTCPAWSDVDPVLILTDQQREARRALLRAVDEIHKTDCSSIPAEGMNGPFPCDCGVPQRIREALA